MRYEIRELSLGGILDQAITLLKNHFGVLFSIVAFTVLPVWLIIAVAQLVLLPPPPTVIPPDIEELMAYAEAAEEHAPLLNGLNLLMLIAGPISNAALVHAIAKSFLGERATAGGAIGTAFTKFFPLIWTWILVVAAIMGGMILLIIPGIIAAFWFSLATQVVVVEGVSGFKAMGRSREIMRGNIGAYFVLGLCLGIIGFFTGLGVQFIPQHHVRMFLPILVQSVMTIFGSAAVVVFYFSARCRNEQFDLHLLAENIGSAPAEAPADDEVFSPEG